MQTGIFKQILLDDAGEVLVVCDVLGKDHEGNGNVCHGNRADVCTDVSVGKVIVAAEGFYEGEVGIPLHVGELGEVDDLEGFDICRRTDTGEYCGGGVTGKDTDNEGDELHHLFAEHGAEGNDCKGYKRAYKASDRVSIHGEGSGGILCSADSIADGVTREGKTDDCNCGTDNDCGHELCDPTHTCEFNDKSDYHINEGCKCRTDDKTEVSDRGGNSAGERRAH